MAYDTDVELHPGSVVWLDADRLRSSGQCETNSTNPDFDVQGPHYFLLTGYQENEIDFFAAALLSNEQSISKNRCSIDSNLKDGPGNSWRNVTSYIYRFQTWKIPAQLIRCFVQMNDYAPRSYATGQPDVVAEIARWMAKNTNPWHSTIPPR